MYYLWFFRAEMWNSIDTTASLSFSCFLCTPRSFSEESRKGLEKMRVVLANIATIDYEAAGYTAV